MHVQPHFWFFGLRYSDLVGQSCPFYKEKLFAGLFAEVFFLQKLQ